MYVDMAEVGCESVTPKMIPPEKTTPISSIIFRVFCNRAGQFGV